jgi:hypothetical protein
MMTFGSLTYRNISQIRALSQQNVDRQLTRMTLFQIIMVVICIFPYSINSAYTLITENMVKDANR